MLHFKSAEYLEAIVQSPPLEVTVVVPTLNELGNIEPLTGRLKKVLVGLEWELIFVDDGSTDGTPEQIHQLAQSDRRLRLIRRFGRRGLASAVIEGALASTTPVIAVIDADLQHDETILPRLIHPLLAGSADVAVGTRYANGGSTEGLNRQRLWISQAATKAAHRLTRTDCTDPMSGLFAVRREALLAAHPKMSSVGYKVLYDILASAPQPLRVVETPYRFGQRLNGESKLDSAVALEFIEMLLDKSIGRYVPAKMLLFGLIGAVGVIVHLALLDVALGSLLLPFAVAQALAVIGAMTFNFFLNNQITYRDQKLRGRLMWRGLATFYLVCAIGAVGNVGIGSLVYQHVSMWWIAGIAGAIVGSAWNYVATGWLTWKRR